MKKLFYLMALATFPTQPNPFAKKIITATQIAWFVQGFANSNIKAKSKKRTEGMGYPDELINQEKISTKDIQRHISYASLLPIYYIANSALFPKSSIIIGSVLDGCFCVVCGKIVGKIIGSYVELAETENKSNKKL